MFKILGNSSIIVLISILSKNRYIFMEVYFYKQYTQQCNIFIIVLTSVFWSGSVGTSRPRH